MKIKVSFGKGVNFQNGAGEIIASITVADRGDYPTEYVFYDSEEGRGYAFLQESFPLSLAGLKEARKWVGENIAHLREEVLFWRNFELPPEEEIEI